MHEAEIHIAKEAPINPEKKNLTWGKSRSCLL